MQLLQREGIVREEILAMAAKVKGDLGIPEVLVNNAGSYYLQVGRTQD